MKMRSLPYLAMALLPLCAAAVSLDVAQLPTPVFADREVSGDAALPANRLEKLRVFRLEMTFASTPSNNVQVAFGRDNRPADGRLAAEETDFIIGWDCGEWFIRPQGLRERFVFAPAVTNGTRTLTASIRVTSTGVFHSPVFADNGTAFGFAGLVLTPFPDWLKPDLWTHLRVTVRGADFPAENIKAVFASDGARIIIK
jgi:hypothetical protein